MKKKFSLYGLFNSRRDDLPDLEEEDTSPTLKRFFKLLGRKFWKLISLNIMMTSEASAYDPGFTFALLTLSALPTMLFFTIFQKQISQGGIAMGSLKG